MNICTLRGLGMMVLLCLFVAGAMAKERVRFERGIDRKSVV